LQNLSSLVITNSNSTNNQRNINTNNNNNNNNEINFESSPLTVASLALDHPILNKNNQLMNKLFKLLSLISQSFQIHIIANQS